MNYYLVDYENVRADGLRQLELIGNGSVVIIFYSEQCKGISLDIIEDFTRRQVRLSCYKVKTGTKNALDFQLASHLGYLLGKESSASCTIISDDKGYDCLCDFWREQDRQVDRKGTVTVTRMNEPKQTKTGSEGRKKRSKVQKSDLATLEEIKKVLSEGDDPEEVLLIFNQYKSKLAICNGMAKRFKDSKRASEVYKKLRPLLKEKNKS